MVILEVIFRQKASTFLKINATKRQLLSDLVKVRCGPEYNSYSDGNTIPASKSNPIQSRSYFAFSVLFSRLGSPRHWQGSRGFSVVVVVVVVLVVVGAGVGAAPVSVALLPT